jgi:hypothetical protein
MKHRGVRYEIRKIADNEWQWTFYFKKSPGIGKVRGTVTGTRDDAEVVCKRTIDSGSYRVIPLGGYNSN